MGKKILGPLGPYLPKIDFGGQGGGQTHGHFPLYPGSFLMKKTHFCNNFFINSPLSVAIGPQTYHGIL